MANCLRFIRLVNLLYQLLRLSIQQTICQHVTLHQHNVHYSTRCCRLMPSTLWNSYRITPITEASFVNTRRYLRITQLAGYFIGSPDDDDGTAQLALSTRCLRLQFQFQFKLQLLFRQHTILTVCYSRVALSVRQSTPFFLRQSARPSVNQSVKHSISSPAFNRQSELIDSCW